jgi:predicted ATPase
VVAETEHRTWEAELYRLQGELLLKAGDGRLMDEPPEVAAEACFQQAMAIAQRQGARSWELRATVSLARLWHSLGWQEKREAARHMLAEVYGWFTEGFDPPDLKEARALLEALAQSCGRHARLAGR